MGLTRISHHQSTAAADASDLTGRSPSSQLDVVSTTPAPSSGPSTPPDRRLGALATIAGEKCGLTLKSARLISIAMLLSVLVHGMALSYFSINSLQKQGTKNAAFITVTLTTKAHNTPQPQMTSDNADNNKPAIHTPVKPKPVPKPVKKKIQPAPSKKSHKQHTDSNTPDRNPDLDPPENPQSNPIETSSTLPKTVMTTNASILNNAAMKPSVNGAAPVTIPPQSPAYLNNPPPLYPVAAKRRGMQGSVLLEVTVNTAGTASKVTIKQSSGFKILDKSAVEAVAAWKFIPALQNDNPIESTVEIPIRFELTQS